MTVHGVFYLSPKRHKLCRNKRAESVVIAAPVSSPYTAAELENLADEAVILEKPPYFRAVAQAYRYWHDVTDEEVIQIMIRNRH